MIALLTAYLVGLLAFTLHYDHVRDRQRFRQAWIVFALIPACHVFFTFVRAMAFTSYEFEKVENLALVSVWNDGLVWLLFAISIFRLIGALLPDESTVGSPTSPPLQADPSAPQPGSPAHSTRTLK